jgi:putrescine aminotransferase
MDPELYYAEVIEKTATYVNPGLAKLLAFAGFGVEMKAEGCYIWDQEGKKYLDCLGGYGTFALGHRHPKVVEAVKRQLDTMPLSAKAFFNTKQADLAEMLAKRAPKGLQYTFFSNSGTEAVEAALKFAKAATGKAKIVSTHGGYHGKTIGALATTGKTKYQKKFEPLMPGVEFIDYGELDQASVAIDGNTAAIIVETIQGEGGIVVPPAGYIAGLRGICNRTGALLIADEVQTGMGRAGTLFGCEVEGITPDILTLAKALGGGVMPIGATMGTPEVWDKVFGENPLLHTSTFGGNELACAAGIATIQTIEEEGLLERCQSMGERLIAGLNQVQADHSDLVKEVRGRGLMIGVELTMDEVGELSVAQMLKRGMCVAYTLNNPRVIRFEPPYIITESEVDFAVETFRSAIAETSELLASLV